MKQTLCVPRRTLGAQNGSGLLAPLSCLPCLAACIMEQQQPCDSMALCGYLAREMANHVKWRVRDNA